MTKFLPSLFFFFFFGRTAGVELLRNPRYNKGMSFTDDERDKMHLRGLLPPAKFTQNMQVKRVMRNVRALQSPVEQHFHLLGKGNTVGK